MKNKQNLTLLLLTTILLLSHIDKGQSQQFSADQCDTPLMVSCALQIRSAFQKCSSESNAKACIDQILESSKCYSCVCRILPDVCIKEDENETYQEELKLIDVNKLINKFATCGAQEIFKCRQTILHTITACGGSQLKCIQDKLANSECEICLCQVAPNLCEQNKELKEEDQQRKDQETKYNQNPFSFLGNILDLAKKTLQQTQGGAGGPKDQNTQTDHKNHDQKQEKVEAVENQHIKGLENLQETIKQVGKFSSMFFGENSILGKITQQIDQIAPQNIGSVQIQASTPEDLQPKLPTGIKEAMKFLGQSGNLGIMDKLKVNQDDLKNIDQNQFETLQQKVMEKLMRNPQIITKVMPMLTSGKGFDVQELKKALGTEFDDIMGDDLDDQSDPSDPDSDFENDQQPEEPTPPAPVKECTKEIYKKCKWDILKLLPSCISLDTKVCLTNLMGQKNDCISCICKLVPETCK